MRVDDGGGGFCGMGVNLNGWMQAVVAAMVPEGGGRGSGSSG